MPDDGYGHDDNASRQIADHSERRCVADPATLKVMIMRLEAFGGAPGVFEKPIPRYDVSGDEAPAAPKAQLCSLGFEKGNVAFEQPPAS